MWIRSGNESSIQQVSDIVTTSGHGQNIHNIRCCHKAIQFVIYQKTKSRLPSSQNIQYLSKGGSHNIQYLLLYSFLLYHPRHCKISLRIIQKNLISGLNMICLHLIRKRWQFMPVLYLYRLLGSTEYETRCLRSQDIILSILSGTPCSCNCRYHIAT